MTFELLQTPRQHALVAWRSDQLVRSGFSTGLATRIARDRHFDLHALIELVERGCPPELAVRILAPVESRDTT